MSADTRESKRFEDIGRVEAPKICPLAGVLDNVSRGGLKVHYSFPVAVDADSDYEISITFARAASNSIELIVHPKWIKNTNGTTEIGFKILPSKGSVHLSEYIKNLGLEQESSISDQITNSGIQLI